LQQGGESGIICNRWLRNQLAASSFRIVGRRAYCEAQLHTLSSIAGIVFIKRVLYSDLMAARPSVIGILAELTAVKNAVMLPRRMSIAEGKRPGAETVF
jgi:hypothetical protein